MSYGWGWRPYVPVAKRRAKAHLAMEKMRKKGANIQPVKIDGKKIARTFWGMSWCEHLEKFSDYENRLPRGRTYVRNGSVCHLEIQKGRVAAKVSGSSLYDVTISIKALSKPLWNRVRESCAGQVASTLELLQGKLSDRVMSVVMDREHGLFPHPRDISMDCSCPDWAGMCKHVAAVMYGIGSRLDEQPELLFVLRGVDHNELISKAAAASVLNKARKTDRKTLEDSRLSEVYGIDLVPLAAAEKSPSASRKRRIGATSAGKSSGPPKRIRRKAIPETNVIPAKKKPKVAKRAGVR